MNVAIVVTIVTTIATMTPIPISASGKLCSMETRKVRTEEKTKEPITWSVKDFNGIRMDFGQLWTNKI